MLAVFRKTLQERRLLVLIYTLGSIALLWMYIAMFPTFKDQSAGLEQVIKGMPESFLKAFNFDLANFTRLEGFLATEQFSFVWPIIAIFMMTGFAGFALAGEIEHGTIELLLSLPISRLKIYISRYLAGLSILIVYVLLSILASIPLASAYSVTIEKQNILAFAILAFLFGWAIYSLGMFLSSLFSDRGRVYFVMGGLLVVMYVLNIVAAIRDSLANLKYFSFFYYYNPAQALIHNKIDHWAYLIFIAVAILSIILGAIIFSKRDMVA